MQSDENTSPQEESVVNADVAVEAAVETAEEPIGDTVETDETVTAIGTPEDYAAIKAHMAALKAIKEGGEAPQELEPLTPLQQDLLASQLTRAFTIDESDPKFKELQEMLVKRAEWAKTHRVLFGRVVTMKKRVSKTRGKKKSKRKS